MADRDLSVQDHGQLCSNIYYIQQTVANVSLPHLYHQSHFDYCLLPVEISFMGIWILMSSHCSHIPLTL